MALVKPREMTEACWAARRANAQKSQGPVTPQGKANTAAAHLLQSWRLTRTLMKIREGVLDQKDSKNEDRSEEVIENKGQDDNMPEKKSDFVPENAETSQNSPDSVSESA